MKNNCALGGSMNDGRLPRMKGDAGTLFNQS